MAVQCGTKSVQFLTKHSLADKQTLSQGGGTNHLLGLHTLLVHSFPALCKQTALQVSMQKGRQCGRSCLPLSSSLAPCVSQTHMSPAPPRYDFSGESLTEVICLSTVHVERY